MGVRRRNSSRRHGRCSCAGGEARGPAFASYLAALDAEEAAAAAMAGLTQRIAA
jgi:hypothetical protein